MKRLVSLFLIVMLLVSCAPVPEEAGPHLWEHPQPEGLFVFYYFSTEQERRRFGLVNAHREVVVPIEYDGMSVLRSFSPGCLPADTAANERFFSAQSAFEDDEGGVFSAVALISPNGNFLTGFHYAQLMHMPGNPTQIIGRRLDDDQFVHLDHYGVEVYDIEDEQLLYALGVERYWLWPDPHLLSTPEIPEQGFEEIIRTRSGNFWGISSSLEGEHFQEVRLYGPSGFLLTRDVYNRVDYIGNGLYTAHLRAAPPFESYIVNQNGRRLAGPYERFIYHYRLPYVLGISGNTAYIIRTDTFHEVRSIEIPRGGSLELVGDGKELAKITYGQQPLTLIVLSSGAEIVFENLADIPELALDCHNQDLSRFILTTAYGESLLVDRQGRILASGYLRISSWFGYLVAVGYTQADEEYEEAEIRYSLLDWDGNILLGPEFTFLEPLPGNALHVVRDGLMGITDLGGNWIYIHSPSRGALRGWGGEPSSEEPE